MDGIIKLPGQRRQSPVLAFFRLRTCASALTLIAQAGHQSAKTRPIARQPRDHNFPNLRALRTVITTALLCRIVGADNSILSYQEGQIALFQPAAIQTVGWDEIERLVE